MSIFDDFTNEASSTIESGLERIAPIGGGTQDDSGAPTATVGGTIFDAIYQFGRGKGDTALQSLTAAFRKTATGQKVEADATTARIKELLPYILLGIAVLFGGFFLLRR